MSDAKHTPGPWRISYERGTTQIRTADNTSIMCDETYYPWVPDNLSDWDLIAAAPDLLAALELAWDYMSFHDGEYDCQDQLQKMQSALAKAKGKS